MKLLASFLGRIGATLHPITIVLIIVALNISWTLTLDMFGRHFQAVAGAPLLDLQNVRSILSVDQAAALISTYSNEAKSLYWSFFIMDNLMPPLVFGAFALLWAKLFHDSALVLFKRLTDSPILLLPLGVGLFDWFENLAFITAMVTLPDAGARTALQIGLIFVQLKALCLFATFGLTMAFLVYAAVGWLGRRLRRTELASR